MVVELMSSRDKLIGMGQALNALRSVQHISTADMITCETKFADVVRELNVPPHLGCGCKTSGRAIGSDGAFQYCISCFCIIK
jgi:hypothetical protein